MGGDTSASPVPTLVVAGLVVTAALVYVGWRLVTPAECLWLGSSPGEWTSLGVVPTPVDGCSVTDRLVVVGTDPGAAVTTVRLQNGSIVAVPTWTGAQLVSARAEAAAATLLYLVTFVALGIVGVRRSPRDPHPQSLLLLASCLLSSGLVMTVGLPPSTSFGGAWRWLFVFMAMVVYLGTWGTAVLAVLLLPRTPAWLTVPRRWWIVAAPIVVGVAAVVIGTVATATFSGMFHVALLTQSVTVGACLVATLSVLARRFYQLRHEPAESVVRQQMLWLGGSFVVGALAFLSFWLIPRTLTGSPFLPADFVGLSGLIFVAGLGVAMSRYRLFDLDPLLRRAVLFSALSLVAVLAYVAAAALLTRAMASDRTITAGAAVITALTLLPVHQALRRLLNRLFYGDRQDPYTALSRIARELGGGGGMSTVAADVRRALRVPYVAVERPDGSATTSGQPADDASRSVRLPLRGVGGTLVVHTRERGETLTTDEYRLLEDVAQQIAAALTEAELTEELRRSRERIVLAREEERRALRRTLHDDMGPSLASLALRIETVRRMLARGGADAGEVDDALAEASRGASTAATAVRTLAYDLRPPSLDERGLVLALVDHAETLAPLEVSLNTTGFDDAAEPLPAAVESAAFRIVAGALANVRRHSAATSCDIMLDRSPARLRIVVSDNGLGLRPDRRPGVGIAAMRERALELGGTFQIASNGVSGTVATAVLPLAGDVA